jgi:hypothetical protein
MLIDLEGQRFYHTSTGALVVCQEIDMPRNKKLAKKLRIRSAPQKRSTRALSKDSELEIPKLIFANVSPHSIGGRSMFDAGAKITARTVDDFNSEAKLIARTRAKLLEAGFKILQVTKSTINIAGTAKAYERAFGAPIIVKQRRVRKEMNKVEAAEFLDSPNNDVPGLITTRATPFESLVEGVAIEEPRYYMAANPFAPPAKYWHLDVPGDVSLGCNADLAHRLNITGKNVKVAMVDSGWFKHPFFVDRGYRVKPVTLGPGATKPDDDESGHGTGESANIFAVAPDAQLHPVKMNFVNSTGAFNAAVALQPDIITCSWGSSNQNGPLSPADQVLAAAVAAAVASGITVVFSAGNGHFGFPGQHPDVISAGGAFMNADGTFRASNYASGFASNIFANRTVPDVCGLVGMLPGAMYIMLPLQPGDEIDVGNARGTHPNGDETPDNDGWAAFIKEARPGLKPAEIRDLMRATARDVKTGNCNPASGGHPARPGHDLATGHGLVDAHGAVAKAMLMRRPMSGGSSPRPLRRPSR